jgi:phosphoribosyl-AMP cyclohydrolase
MTETASPNFTQHELIPAIVQHAVSKEVLMLAYMNADAYRKTLRTGQAHFWSRSRKSLWHKGATSGHFQNVVEMYIDCDEDAILLLVMPEGPACHTGNPTCFYRHSLPENE